MVKKTLLIKLSLFSVMLIALLLAGYRAVQGQGDGLPPAIVQFAADIKLVALPAVENGSAKVTFTWKTVGLPDKPDPNDPDDDYKLLLYYFRINDWALVTNQNLPPSGAASLNIQSPLDFGPPTYRLAIVDRLLVVVSQQIVVIPYEVNEVQVPKITAFTTDVESIASGVLAQNQALVNVSWKVADRVPYSNLVFEQVFPDGTAKSVELPRTSRWIASVGQGPLKLVPVPANATAVKLRMRVIDLREGKIYNEAELNLPIATGAAIPTLQITPIGTGTPLSLPTSVPPTPTPQ